MDQKEIACAMGIGTMGHPQGDPELRGFRAGLQHRIKVAELAAQCTHAGAIVANSKLVALDAALTPQAIARQSIAIAKAILEGV